MSKKLTREQEKAMYAKKDAGKSYRRDYTNKETIKKIDINQVNFKSDEMKDFTNELIDNGFKVYCSPDKSMNDRVSYFHFEKNGNVGYCQHNDFSGFDFSTVHKPCRECGTGFRINDDGVTPSIEWAEKTFVTAPYWAKSNDKKAVKKYDGFEDYLSEPTNRILSHKEITKSNVR